MAETAAERTEPATPKRREDSRKKGEVAQSRDVSSVVVLAVAFALAFSPLADALSRALGTDAVILWQGAIAPPATLADYHALILHVGAVLARALAPLALILVVGAWASSMVQVGPLFSWEALAPRWNRLDPIAGLKRLVSPERAFDLAKSLVKFAAVVGVGTAVIAPWIGTVLAMPHLDPRSALGLLESLAGRFVIALLLSLGVLAVIDLVWVRWRHERKLRMTRQEVRDELRQREGSPEVRQRLRALQRELTSQRMIAAVAEADVVIRNPTHYAVALKYVRTEMSAPRVVAKGRNRVAERILEAAREHRVPIVENPPLARMLHRMVRVGREVPESLYEAVAEVLAYVFRVDRRRGAAWRSAP